MPSAHAHVPRSNVLLNPEGLGVKMARVGLQECVIKVDEPHLPHHVCKLLEDDYASN